MGDPDREGRGGARGEPGIGAPQPPRSGGDPAEEGEQGGEADEPELAERSEVERVRLTGGIEHVTLLEPVDHESARADPLHGVVGEGAERDAPVRVAVRVD